jgi:hypothetical protein
VGGSIEGSGAEPTVALRDLGPAYGKLRLQYVCVLRAGKGYTPRHPFAARDEVDEGRATDTEAS